MTDYIKRDDVIEAIKKDIMGGLNARCILEEFPAADVVEVVRCQDCKWYQVENNSDHGYCGLMNGYNNRYPDDYCSYGERE